MKKILFTLTLAVVLIAAFAGCELFAPTILVSGSVYTNNYSAATLGQAFETTLIYPVVVMSTEDADLGGTDVAALDIETLLALDYVVGDSYTSPFWMTQFDNDDYGPIEVSMSTSASYRVLFIQDTDSSGTITSTDKIVGASSTSSNVYTSGEETGTDSVQFYWDLVVDM